MTQSGCDTLARALFVLRYLPHRPEHFTVEAALETLMIEDEVLS